MTRRSDTPMTATDPDTIHDNDRVHDVIVHACPPLGSGVMPCCGLSPFEVNPLERMTIEGIVTCPVVPNLAADVEAFRSRVLDAAAYVEKTLDNVNGGTFAWENAEVCELLVDIRLLLDGKPLAGQKP